MNVFSLCRTATLVFMAILVFPLARISAQQPAAKRPLPAQSATSRLAGAKTVLIRRTHGSQIPYDVIRSTVEGWGRFTLVDSPEKADLVMEVATTGGDNSVRESSSTGISPKTGQVESSTSSSRDLSGSEITLTVLDGKNKSPLWTGKENAKFAMKENARENNLVEAAERLARKFHDRLEPPSAR